MKDFTWKVFCETGNIDTYLLFKELESEGEFSFSFMEDKAEDLPLQ
ncbi:YqzL family protein [Fictibacillus iocasae]|uniref:YqzL family protein n=1 Tax=Fictibacillus iocasae TaxID=2715437 RepID=A0ABW2NV76_9BACL